MNPTGTHFNYYQVCKRKLWLFANGINMEHTSELVKEGKFIHEESYPQRSEKYEEVEVDGVKVDFYDAKNKVIHEIKKSDRIEKAHEWQLKFYLYVFEKHGISGVSGVLEYPTMRQTEKVELTDDDRHEIDKICSEIGTICESDDCPPIVKKGFCKNCSYYDLCFVNEEMT
ncbi:MAG: CRISPR-associated protein Cas4 [Alphaproteobacteria bacterium]|nr:CRISPR-associated protein Cas4 [Alphaproteobacteria bacterium]